MTKIPILPNRKPHDWDVFVWNAARTLTKPGLIFWIVGTPANCLANRFVSRRCWTHVLSLMYGKRLYLGTPRSSTSISTGAVNPESLKTLWTPVSASSSRTREKATMVGLAFWFSPTSARASCTKWLHGASEERAVQTRNIKSCCLGSEVWVAEKKLELCAGFFCTIASKWRWSCFAYTQTSMLHTNPKAHKALWFWPLQLSAHGKLSQPFAFGRPSLRPHKHSRGVDWDPFCWEPHPHRIPFYFYIQHAGWYSEIRAASSMWTRSILSDLAISHMPVNPIFM